MRTDQPASCVIFRPADAGIVARWPVGELRRAGRHAARGGAAGRAPGRRGAAGDRGSRAAPPARLARAAARAARPAAAGRRPRIAAFGATLAALVGLFWLAVDYGSEYAAPLLPYSLQAKLGESVFDELTGRQGRSATGSAGLAAINDLANRLAKAADYPHRSPCTIVEGGPVNAFTLPGGILVFYSDLIDQAKDGTRWRACWRTRSATSCTITR